MFTGIVEAVGEVKGIEKEGKNVHFKVSAPFLDELRVDQSVAHNGVCLTVTRINGDSYEVTAVDETLKVSNLGDLRTGDSVNLERCVRLGDRMDGHLVQGHVDATAHVVSIEEQEGSWLMTFELADDSKDRSQLMIEKGSICVNGISLTCFGLNRSRFTIAVIPYTYSHTNLGKLEVGQRVNIEFDMVGKYIAQMIGCEKEKGAMLPSKSLAAFSFRSLFRCCALLSRSSY